MECVGADSAAMKITYKIIGHQTGDLIEILRRFALEIGVDHIAYVRMGSNKSLESSLFASYVTYPKEWQRRDFLKQYFNRYNSAMWNVYIARSGLLSQSKKMTAPTSRIAER